MLGLTVKVIHKGDKGGEVRISYKTLEQLDDLIRRLKNNG
jgi:ParB family chromosome partitioning protein